MWSGARRRRLTAVPRHAKPTSRVGEPAPDPDRDIVRLITRDGGGTRVAANRTAALRALMRRHGAAVYRYCREELHDATLAEDVHQQIFIQAHRDMATFAGRSTLRAWLFAIARHRVLDAAKSRRRALAHIEEDDAADATDPTPPAGQRLDDLRLRQALIACVARLGAHVRTAILLRYQQDFTFEEMAEICGARPGTLQARVARALPLLRACIAARTAAGR